MSVAVPFPLFGDNFGGHCHHHVVLGHLCHRLRNFVLTKATFDDCLTIDLFGHPDSCLHNFLGPCFDLLVGGHLRRNFDEPRF